jgi:hypothetical protein
VDLILHVDDLDAEQRQDLLEKFRCADAELPDRLARVATAAYDDYLEMIRGVPLPSRAEEVRERRLLHLLKRFATEGVLLTEDDIAVMFQMSRQEAGRLLRNVRVHFHAELDSRVKAAVREILVSAKKTNGNYQTKITSANLLDVLKSKVTSAAPDLDQIVKVRGSAALYDIPPDTYKKLCEIYGTGVTK